MTFIQDSFSQVFASTHRYRKLSTKSLAVACILLVSGCASTPDRDSTLQAIDEGIEYQNRQRQIDIAFCNGDQQCIDAVNESYNQLKQKSLELRNEVVKEAWKNAEQRKKELEQKLLNLIPEYPHLQHLLDQLRKGGALTNLEAEGSLTFTPQSPTPSDNTQTTADHDTNGLFTEKPARQYTLSGVMTIYDQLFGGPISIDGHIWVVGGWDQDHEVYQASIAAGQIHASMLGEYFDFNVARSNQLPLVSSITADASGNGYLELAVTFDPDAVAGHWRAWFHSVAMITLPIHVHTDGRITFAMSRGVLGDLLPYEPWTASDYNQDGTLDVETDFAAYLDGYNAHEAMADSNFDGAWTPDDIALWQQRFDEDAQH